MRKNKLALAIAGAAGLCMSATAFGQTFSSTTTPVAINDLSVASDTINVAGGPASIVGMSVALDITHTWDADLDVALVSPGDADYLTLFRDVGGAGDNFTGTVMIDGGAAITAGVAPFAGNFAPQGGAAGFVGTLPATFVNSFSAFAGRSGNGAWRMELNDDAGGDVGTLNSWSITFTGTAPPPPPPPPAGDNCADAPLVADGTYPYDLTLMTSEGNEGAVCGGSVGAQDQWFLYTAASCGTLNVTTCGLSGFDSVLAAYDACGGAIIVCNDDNCGLQSTINVPMQAGQSVRVRIAEFGGGVHAGSLAFAFSGGGAPANDTCASAESLFLNSPSSFDLTCANADGSDSCSGSGTDVYYTYTAASTNLHAFIGGAANVSVIDATCAGAELACGLDPVLSLNAGQVVLVRVSGVAGAGTIEVDEIVPPANDLCANAIGVGEGTATWDNTDAQTDGPDECLNFGVTQISSDVWFLYTATAAADIITIDLCGSGIGDTKLAVYDAAAGCPTVTSAIACNDDSCGLQSRVRICGVTAGAQYLIRVGTYTEGDFGSGVLNIAASAACDVTQPSGSATEAETCGGDANGGCNLANTYEAISCGGAVVFGSSFADANLRDTDWYSFSQFGPGDITATVNAEFPAVAFILSGTCPPTFFGTAFATDELNTCADITATATAAPAGDYAIFVSVGTAAGGLFAGYPCGGAAGCAGQNDYVLTVSNTGSCIPLGACCAPSGCSIMTEAECATAGGTYLGDESACETPGGYNFAAGTAAIEDISGTGTNLGLTDDSNALATLGFTFNFYGVGYSDCFVGSNGLIGFGAGSNVFGNGAIPSAALPNNMLYVYWDDLNPGAGGEVYAETRGTAGTDLRFIAQWNNVPQFGGADANTFQCIIWENGTVEYRYQTVPGLGGGDATIGSENADGTVATSVDEALAVSGTSLTGTYTGGGSNCPTCPWQADGCYADFNNDGGIDGDDVIAFFAEWDASLPCADVEGSGGVDGDDVIAFFGSWDASGGGTPGC